jgi:hypothetical protein
MSKDDRNNQILYWKLVRNKPQADIGRMFDNISRQRVNDIIQTYLKRFVASQQETFTIQMITGERYQFSKGQVQQYL